MAGTEESVVLEIVVIEKFSTLRAEDFVAINDSAAIIAAIGTALLFRFVVSLHFRDVLVVLWAKIGKRIKSILSEGKKIDN